MNRMPRPVILASASTSRARLLRSAGVPFSQVAAAVDEAAVKAALHAEGATAADCAETLAEMKAVKVSQGQPDALVIGADQLLDCRGAWFDKPQDMAAARRHLTALSGTTHTLATSVVVAQGGARIWHHAEQPALTMRTLSEAFIAHYLDAVGDAVLSSVGAYHLEGRGAQLFTRIDGDYFAILGLPLIPLLAFLREHGILPT
ncbi:MAG: Maf family protein [Rhodospirillaceae bacterium]|nr:Maf family protein [Rhodospirillaceae bacterium]